MSIRVETYQTLNERAALISSAEALDERMLHDEVQNGVPTLVFVDATDDPDSRIPSPPTSREEAFVRLQDIRQKPTLTMVEIKSAIDDIIDFLGI